jgi:hypothetical protein
VFTGVGQPEYTTAGTAVAVGKGVGDSKVA